MNTDWCCRIPAPSLCGRKGSENMASDREYLDYVLEQLAELDEISWKKMMGEYILYCQGKIIGGIYDNRLLVRPTETAMAMMPQAKREVPYEGAKEMLLVSEIDDRQFLCRLFAAMAEELPALRKRK